MGKTRARSGCLTCRRRRVKVSPHALPISAPKILIYYSAMREIHTATLASDFSWNAVATISHLHSAILRRMSARVIAVEARKWAAVRSGQPSDVNQGQPSRPPLILKPALSHEPHCSADTGSTGAPHSPPTVGDVCDSANEYASHWETKILPQLPRAFQHVKHRYQIYKASRTAAVVLASADLSDTLRSSHLALSLEHRKRNHGYYEATLRILADKAWEESGMRMAALLLLAVYELTCATVRGCTVHLREADKIVAAWCTNRPAHCDESWCKLICAWPVVWA